MRKFGAGFFLIYFSALLVLFGFPEVSGGQVSDVQLAIEQNDVGLGRYVQPGVWTPMRITLLNQSAELRNVITRWVLSDEDGDLVLSQRMIPLNPGVTQSQWLYADMPMAHRQGDVWEVQVLDEKTRRLLAKQSVFSPEPLSVFQSAIGVCATTDLGLGDYEPGYTQHESVKFVRGLQLSQLPDRWYGMAMLRTLIWTNEGSDPFNDPSDASVTPEIVDALRKWVERGGHLVISMPMIGQTWSDSPFGDLMPVRKSQMQVVEDFDPILLGPLRGQDTHEPIQAMVFDVDARDVGEGVAVLATDRHKRPYIVAKRFGFGRVTLIGIDLARPVVRRRGLPSGRIRLWNTVFHWNAPLVTEREYEGETRNMKMVRVRDHEVVSLDKNMPLLVAMTGRAATALFSAILVFGLYWLLAGPVAYVVLKRRGMAHHSWLAFVILAGLFTMMTWGGAWIMRPAHTAIEHVSILDIDANTATVHTRSWLSLLVPKFGQAEVAIDREGTFDGHWLASPGFETGPESGGGQYLDPQSYQQNAANPRRVVIPVRSTAKRFAIDYMGRLDVPMPGMEQPWVLPHGNVRIRGGWPVGELVHDLPGQLKNVLIIFCPGTTSSSGDLQMPWVGYIASWPAKKTLELKPPPAMRYERLLQPLAFYKTKGISITFYNNKRTWANEGYLGRVVGAQRKASKVQQTPAMVKMVDNRLMQQLQLLSFYDALPPPSFRDVSDLMMTRPAFYRRALMRHIDMTPLIAGRRLIVIGQLEDSPLPAPLTLDGDSVPSQGLTLVRWIYDL